MKAVSNWKNLIDIYGTDDNIRKAEDMLSEVERLLLACGAEVKKILKTSSTRKSK
jgi:hypothetical protein